MKTNPFISFLLLIVVSLGLRLFHLGVESVWYDEAGSIKMAAAPAGQILSGRVHEAGNPPLYYFLLHYWLKWQRSSSERSARSLSVLFGVLGVLTLWMAVSRWLGREIGWWAALILALSPPHIELSQDARSYTLAIFLALISFYALQKFRDSCRIRDGIWYALASVSLMYTHYYGLFIVFTQFLYLNALGWEPLWVRLRRNWIFILLGILYIPWMPILIGQMSQSISRSGETWWLHALALPYYLTVGRTLAWRDAGVAVFAAAEMVTLLVIAVPFYRGVRAAIQRAPLIVFWLAGIFAVAILISVLSAPLLNTRYLSLIMPAFAAILAAGLIDLFRASRRYFTINVLGLTALVALSLWRLYTVPQKEDWRSLVGYIGTHRTQTEAVLLLPGYVGQGYRYYDRDAAGLIPLLAPPADAELRAYSDGHLVQDDIAARPGAWLVLGGPAAQGRYPGIQTKLASFFPNDRETDFCKLKLIHYWK